MRVTFIQVHPTKDGILISYLWYGTRLRAYDKVITKVRCSFWRQKVVSHLWHPSKSLWQG